MTAQGFDHEAWDAMASAPLLNQGPPSTTGGITVADLEAAAARLAELPPAPAAIRAHPADLEQLRSALPPPAGPAAMFYGLRFHADPTLARGRYVSMTADQERAWLNRRSWAEAIRGMRRLGPAVRITADWMNAIQQELVRVVEAAGLLFTAGKRSRHRQRERNRAKLHASQLHRSRRSRRRPGGGS